MARFRSQAGNCNIVSWIEKVLAELTGNTYPSNNFILFDIRVEFSDVFRVYRQTFHASLFVCLFVFFLLVLLLFSCSCCVWLFGSEFKNAFVF